MLSEQEKDVGSILVLVKEYNSEDPSTMKFLAPIMIDSSSTFLKLSNEAFIRTSKEMKNKNLTIFI